jgi:hypothetical protein
MAVDSYFIPTAVPADQKPRPLLTHESSSLGARPSSAAPVEQRYISNSTYPSHNVHPSL